MRITLPGSETFTLTGQTIDKLIRAGDSDAALLYLYILRSQGQKTSSEVAKALDKSMGWVASAMAVLSRLGLVQLDELDIRNETQPTAIAGNGVGNTPTRSNEPDKGSTDQQKQIISTKNEPFKEPRKYTDSEIRDELKSDPGFSVIVNETQQKLGKILVEHELQRLLVIYNDLRLPTEVILQLITHCINECKAKGDGRAPSVRYIEKAAFTWEREGIFTLEQAEAYLKALEARKTARGKIKNILQIRNRELSATEKRYVDEWITMGFQPEVIAIAYDKTVTKTGNLTWPYIDKILKNWNEKKLHTVEQVAEKEGKPRTNGFYSSDKSGIKKHGDPNSEDIQRVQRLLNKIKEE